MFSVSICEDFLVLNVFIVCIHNTEMFKFKPLLCTHVYSYMFSIVHPPRIQHANQLSIVKVLDQTELYGYVELVTYLELL